MGVSLTSTELLAIANQFTASIDVSQIQALGNGNINDTYGVQLTGHDHPAFVLQRINGQVFPQPELIMQNLRCFTTHMSDRLQRVPLNNKRRWEVPEIVLTIEGKDHWRSPQGDVWRAIRFIANTHSYDEIPNLAVAQEVGTVLATFHELLSDLHPERLADTLPGFHITPQYLQQYDVALTRHAGANTIEVRFAQQFIGERRHWVHRLEQAKVQGKLPLRVIHGDPKVNNILIDRATGQGMSLIDLDTVKPGLVHYDIGDCLRSGCNPLGEETQQWETVRFELDICQQILQGYMAIAQAFLTEADYDYLYDGIRLMAFELGLRFLTDYLAGNVYFKVAHPDHNLHRALVQFKLTESIETQAENIHQLIQDLR